MVTQKSWVDLLGTDLRNTFPDRRDIVLHLGENRYKILHTCNSIKMARQVFEEWKNQILSSKGY